MKQYLIRSSMTPAIFKIGKYTLAGWGAEVWRVPTGTKMEQLVWEPPKKKPVKKYSITEKVYKYKSRTRKGVVYTVKVLGPYVTCSCPGFMYHRTCPHEQAFKTSWRKRK